MAAAVEKPATVVSGDDLRCFVCDVTVTGRYYTLATCRTQSSKIRLVEKLGQLVGDRYMVIISEDDIICRGCANLMNTLDRLETEMGSVRNVVLRFLEKKYSLEEGELLNDNNSSLCNPSTQSSVQNTSIVPGTKSKTNETSENFMARKRKAALSEMTNEQENSLPGSKKLDPKNNVWMQCDRCKYTTHYNAFMIHHIRQHVKKKTPLCDYCGDEVREGNSCARHCGTNKSAEKADSHTEPSEQFKRYIAGENGELVACEEESESGNANNTEVMTSVHDSMEEGTTTIIIDQNKEENNSKQDDMPQLNDANGSTPTTICVMDMSEESSAEQPTLLTVQKMEEEGNAVYVQVVEVGKGEQAEDASNVTKQVLTVSEDGTVEMVEVVWDDVVAQNVVE